MRSGADGRVLIAGAGPVAMTAALLLARWDVPTVLFEAAPRRDAVGSKAICFQRDVLEILDRVGVAGPAVAEGVTWWHGLTFYRDHELFETTFPRTGQSGVFPPFINISQTSVERYLWERVAAEPLIDVRFAHRVVDVGQDAQDVAVDVETPDGPATHRSAYLLGCDGGSSTVRGCLGLPFPGHSYADRFLIADIRADLPFPAERRFHFDPEWNPGRQVLVHPQPDEVWRIDWQVPADFDLDRERETGALDARIRKITGDAPYEIVWLSVYRFHQRVAPRFRVGRVLLAGDAAHLYSPFGARGLNSGVQDAENAAWKLAFALQGWAGPRLLDSYDHERRAAALENLRVTDRTMQFLVPQDDEQWARRRELLERAVTEPEARTLVDSGKLAEPYWYLDSPLTTPSGDTRDFPREPGVARPVVPGVLCPDAPCRVAGRPEVTRLRQLFGDGFVILVHGDDVPETVVSSSVSGHASRHAHDPAGDRPAAPGSDGPPVQAHHLDEIAIGDADALADVLDAAPGTTTVVRPDGHVAARTPVDDEPARTAALHRACGHD